MMSLPLNQTNPQLNDLLLRGGSSLSPELKEQAIDDILAEFGSAPTKKAAKQAVLAQKQPASPAPSAPLVIDGVDFSEFLDNAPASRKTALPCRMAGKFGARLSMPGQQPCSCGRKILGARAQRAWRWVKTARFCGN